MKLSSLFEANPQRDYEYRKEAQVIYNKTINDLKKNFLYFEKRKDLSNTDEIHLLNFGDKFPQYKDLEICVGKKGAGAYFSKRKNKYIIYFDIWNEAKNSFLDEHKIKEFFIHEFIHYLDQKRSKESSIKNTSKFWGDQQYEKYFNDPSEFNAYFQSGSKKIEDFFDRDKRYIKLWYLIENYHKFEDFILQHYREYFYGEGFLENINEKYKRKFLQRLYQLWIFLKNKYSIKLNRH